MSIIRLFRTHDREQFYYSYIYEWVFDCNDILCAPDKPSCSDIHPRPCAHGKYPWFVTAPLIFGYNNPPSGVSGSYNKHSDRLQSRLSSQRKLKKSWIGVPYSDYKWTHTAYSYISDSQTSDGYTAYYYLIRTAYETTNAFGQNILHEVTARCYYVPEYSNIVYMTYITLDGETVYFDEETEDWLLDIG